MDFWKYFFHGTNGLYRWFLFLRLAVSFIHFLKVFIAILKEFQLTNEVFEVP